MVVNLTTEPSPGMIHQAPARPRLMFARATCRTSLGNLHPVGVYWCSMWFLIWGDIILLMQKIQLPSWGWYFIPLFTGFIHARWCRISSITSMEWWASNLNRSNNTSTKTFHPKRPPTTMFRSHTSMGHYFQGPILGGIQLDAKCFW